jgi:NAD-dependent DNA ligase
MNSFNETAQYAMENKRRLDRNSRFYYEYRNAVAGVLNQLPRDCPLPFGLKVSRRVFAW